MAKMQKLLNFLLRKWHRGIIKSGVSKKSNFFPMKGNWQPVLKRILIICEEQTRYERSHTEICAHLLRAVYQCRVRWSSAVVCLCTLTLFCVLKLCSSRADN